MNDLLNSVGDLTDSRDRDSLEQTLASVMFDLTVATRLDLWRLVRHEDRLKLRRRARFDNSLSCSPQPGAEGSLGEVSALDALPALHACHIARRHLRWPPDGDGLCRHAFPILDRREPIGFLEIHRPTPLNEDEERVVFGLLRVYRNHLGILDSSDCDELTGLLNRRTFDETFRRISAQPGSFIGVVDIDHFKRINDAFGHPYGDEVIVLLTRLMTSVFDDAAHLFRFGGEEFVILHAGSGAAHALELLEHLRAKVESFPFPQVGRVTVSVGVAGILPGDTGAAAFGRADRALYFSKRNGRNQVQSFDALLAAGELEQQSRAAKEVELF